MPALGFGMGDVVLTELLRERNLAPEPPASADVFVAAVTPDDRPFVLGLAHRLRDAGLAVEYAFGDEKLGRQLKLADARRARYAVVLGPDERARGAAVVKDLHAGEQREVPLSALDETLRSGLARPVLTRPSGGRAPAHPSSHTDG
jgi:histidyl-tRNA synthetase